LKAGRPRSYLTIGAVNGGPAVGGRLMQVEFGPHWYFHMKEEPGVDRGSLGEAEIMKLVKD